MQSPHLVFSEWKRSSRVETSTRACLPRASRLGDTVRDGLEAWCSETPTAQYITYNIKWGCLKTRVVQRKRPVVRALALSLPRPRPPRQGPQRKTIHNPPKTPPPSNFLITSAMSQGQIPWAVPIHESSAADPCKGFTPRTRNRPRVSALKNHISSPPAIARTQ